MKHDTINDTDRAQWIDNDEGLYNLCRSECRRNRQTKRQWIRENREQIDAVIRNVRDGRKPAHYLAYGG